MRNDTFIKQNKIYTCVEFIVAVNEDMCLLLIENNMEKQMKQE